MKLPKGIKKIAEMILELDLPKELAADKVFQQKLVIAFSSFHQLSGIREISCPYGDLWVRLYRDQDTKALKQTLRMLAEVTKKTAKEFDTDSRAAHLSAEEALQFAEVCAEQEEEKDPMDPGFALFNGHVNGASVKAKRAFIQWNGQAAWDKHIQPYVDEGIMGLPNKNKYHRFYVQMTFAFVNEGRSLANS